MIEFFLIFIGLPVLLLVVLNYKELLGIWKSPSQQLPPAIEEDEKAIALTKRYNDEGFNSLTQDERNYLYIYWRRCARDKDTRLRREREVALIDEEENRAKSRRNAAYGAVGATIAIGSILLDAHNDHQRMLDVDRRK